MRDPFRDERRSRSFPRPGRWPGDQPSYRAVSRIENRNERPDGRAWAVADRRWRRPALVWLAAACLLLVGFGLGFGAGVQVRSGGDGANGVGPSRAACGETERDQCRYALPPRHTSPP